MFQAIHDGQPDQALLAYQYLQMMPKIAEGSANKVWVVPSEITKALEGLGSAVHEVAGIPKTSSGPRVRVDTDPEAARSSDPASILADTHAEVEKAIAAAEGAARSTGAPPPPPATPPASDPTDSRTGAGQSPTLTHRRLATADGDGRGRHDPVSFWEIVAILFAGMAAGTINTVVGSGTLITFPTLLAFGIPPVTANVSNTIGLAPGSLSGAIGYRRELEGQRTRLFRLGSASLIGGIAGALLLLLLPSSAFDAIVPVLIVLGCVLVVVGPRIQRRVAARAEERGGVAEHGVWWVWPAVLAAGVYGGYFGAAQGVLLMAILGIGVVDSMQRHNATKNVLALIVNGIAAIAFIILDFVHIPGLEGGHVDWARGRDSSRSARRSAASSAPPSAAASPRTCSAP